MDKIQTEKFFNYITYKQENKVFYNTLFARNKYLAKEEREKLKCPSNLLGIELFTPNKYYDNFANYYRNVARFEGGEDAYLSRSSKPLYNTVRAIYAGLNPVDLLKAKEMFVCELATLELRASRGDRPLEQVYSNIPRLFLKNCTNARLIKNIIDIDVDIKAENMYSDIYEEVLNNLCETLMKKLTSEQLADVMFVFTKGGLHILSRTTHFCKEWHTKVLEELAINVFGGLVTELKLNKNAMCPLPGTFQCGHFVYCTTVAEASNIFFKRHEEIEWED